MDMMLAQLLIRPTLRLMLCLSACCSYCPCARSFTPGNRNTTSRSFISDSRH